MSVKEKFKVPELPEVETTKRGILPYSEGKVLKQLVIRNGAMRWPVSEELYHLKNQKIEQLIRRGKYIILLLKKGAILVHLGMSGSLRVVDLNDPVGKHDHVDFEFQNKILRFNDPRRFGCVLWTHCWSEHELISHLGPEPLSEEFTDDYLYKKSRKRSVSIKQFIMDSKVVVGVGNIYANEALFLSGIRPTKPAGKVSKARMTELVENIKKVLSAAITQGGTTLRDFVGGDGKPGYFQQKLFVYGRADEPCKQCGERLKEVRQSGRATVYCRSCQV